MTGEGFRVRASVRRQLVLANVLMLAVVFVVAGLFVRTTVRARLMASVDHDLALRMRMIAGRDGGPRGGPMGEGPPGRGLGGGMQRGRGLGLPPALPPPLQEPGGEGFSLRPRMMDAAGRVLAPPDVFEPWDSQGFSLALARRNVYSNIRVDGVNLRVFSHAQRQPDGAVVVFQIPYPLTDVERALSNLNGTLLAGLPVILLFAAWAGSALTGRALRPVRRITHTAARIGVEDLSERLPVAGDDEFAALSATFNGMLGRLETAFHEQERLVEALRQRIEQERRFTADASHELRTPLTVIKANTSLALADSAAPDGWRRSLQDVDQAADAASALVRDLLLLARSDAGQLGRDPVSLPVREILEAAVSGLPRQDGPAVLMDVPDPSLCVRGNEDELVRVFANLLQNAQRHTPASGTISVSAAREEDAVRIRVRDTGPGVPPDRLPHLGERFYRVDSARTRQAGGAGLGLSISKGIVEAHGGTIAFSSPPGQGLCVTVTLPAGTSTPPPNTESDTSETGLAKRINPWSGDSFERDRAAPLDTSPSDSVE